MTGGEILPTWKYRARGTIWRLIPTNSGKFVGEEREPEQRQTTFFCLSQTSGEVLWHNVGYSERWWIGIEAVHRNVVILHGFAKPDMPEHKGIIAVDLLTGTTLWTNDECKFLIAEGDGVFVSKPALEGEVILELEHQSGAILRSWGSNGQVIREARTRNALHASNTPAFPVPLDSLDDGEVEVANLVRKHCADKPIVGRVELLDREQAVVVNFHERMNREEESVLHLKNTLMVLGRASGTVLFRETLDENVQGTAPDSFFVYGDMLYYIKNRNTLTAVRMTVSARD
jgi:hypothetical protein